MIQAKRDQPRPLSDGYLLTLTLLFLIAFAFTAHTATSEDKSTRKPALEPSDPSPKPVTNVLPLLSAPSGFWKTTFGHIHSDRLQKLADENKTLFETLASGGSSAWNAYSNNIAFEIEMLEMKDSLEGTIEESQFASLITTTTWEELALSFYNHLGIESTNLQVAMEEFNRNLATRLELLRRGAEVYNAVLKGNSILQAAFQQDLSRYSTFLNNLKLNTNNPPELPPGTNSSAVTYSLSRAVALFKSLADASKALAPTVGIALSNNYSSLGPLYKELSLRQDSSAALVLVPISSGGLGSDSLKLLSAHVDTLAITVISNYAYTFCYASTGSLGTNWAAVPGMKAFSNACSTVLSNDIKLLGISLREGPCGLLAALDAPSTERKGSGTTLQTFLAERTSGNSNFRFEAIADAIAEEKLSKETDIEDTIRQLASLAKEIKSSAAGFSKDFDTALTLTSELLDSFPATTELTKSLTLVTNFLSNTNLFHPALTAKLNDPIAKAEYVQAAAVLFEKLAKQSIEQQVSQRRILLQFFLEIASLRSNTVLENIRHQRALGSIISLEAKRWQTILQLHNRYKVEFDYFANYTNSSSAIRKLELLHALPAQMSISAIPSDLTPSGMAQRATDSYIAAAVVAFVDKVDGTYRTPNKLPMRVLADRQWNIKQSDYVWPSLRLLASVARDRMRESPAADLTGAGLRDSHAKLTSAVTLIQGYFLADVYNRRFGQSNYRFLLKEVRQHDSRLLALQIQAKEPEIRLLMGDMALFHAAGWSEADTRSTFNIIQSGLLAWIGYQQ